MSFNRYNIVQHVQAYRRFVVNASLEGAVNSFIDAWGKGKWKPSDTQMEFIKKVSSDVMLA